MVWCYSGLEINFVEFNREVTVIKYLNQNSIKPCLIVHLAALWAFIYQIHCLSFFATLEFTLRKAKSCDSFPK